MKSLLLALGLSIVCSVNSSPVTKFDVDKNQLTNNHTPNFGDADKYCQLCLNVISGSEKINELPEDMRAQFAVDTVRYVCYFIDESDLKQKCHDYVNSHVDDIPKALLIDKITPWAMCVNMTLCGSNSTADDLSQINIPLEFSESNPVKNNNGDDANDKPIGGNQCTWGPAYWCSSKQAMEKCNTFDYCNKWAVIKDSTFGQHKII
ncbi:uncharacterized protein LOC129578323 [Sitodiplosis mosellana]|uniref:uncharacterized protein LOC129578323 n=1 Tax=Sitodiplosis mosellana TaxID=263140 RepID=UPI0024449784|nr:uncharacterized protein LOC129578323 [Sitodiplosis mosellana]